MHRLDELPVAVRGAVQRAAGTVHWARDAAEANADRARGRALTRRRRGGEDEVADDRRDRAERCTRRRRHPAIETDFAELILQLDGDWSSHILVPAIHRNRTEIRDLFVRTIAEGRDLSDDPSELAEAARALPAREVPHARRGRERRELRRRRDGHESCMVESEGNGRMCTTLPPVLVTVMGIEKLVPTLADLEVFLQLLPRSSTGERMNPYTSLWTGVAAGDGPQELHIVLLDNGRTRVLADEVGRAGAALHPLQRVPERLSGLRAHGWARVRLRLSRPDRRDPHAAAARRRERGVAAVRVEPVRRLLRGLPGQDRHPVGAAAPARGGGAEGGSVARAGGDARARACLRRRAALRTGAAARAAAAASGAAPPGPIRSGRARGN